MRTIETLKKMDKLSGSVSSGLEIFIMITALKTENCMNIGKSTHKYFCHHL